MPCRELAGYAFIALGGVTALATILSFLAIFEDRPFDLHNFQQVLMSFVPLYALMIVFDIAVVLISQSFLIQQITNLSKGLTIKQAQKNKQTSNGPPRPLILKQKISNLKAFFSRPSMESEILNRRP